MPNDHTLTKEYYDHIDLHRDGRRNPWCSWCNASLAKPPIIAPWAKRADDGTLPTFTTHQSALAYRPKE